MAENNRALAVTDSDELVVIDSDDDAAPLAPWVRTVSDQAEVAEIIEIKDEEEDDDALFEKEMDVQYGSSPSRVKKEKKPKPDPSPGGPSGSGGAPQGGAVPGGHGGAAAPAPAPAPAAAPPVIGGMPTAAEKTAHLLTLPAGARDLQRLLWHIGITFKLLPHQPVAVSPRRRRRRTRSARPAAARRRPRRSRSSSPSASRWTSRARRRTP